MRFTLIDVPFKNPPEIEKLNLPNYGYGNHLRAMTVEICKEIYDIGFRIVSVPFHPEATQIDIDYAKRVLDESGMVHGPTGASISPVNPDKERENADKKIIAKGLRMSGKIGASLLMVSAGSMRPKEPWKNHPENHTQRSLDRMVESCRELAPVAEDANCILCPETTLWTIINSVERMKEFVDRVDSPYVRITLDPVNHMTYDRIYESGRFIKCAIATLGDRIGNIHCKDVKVDPDFYHVSHIDEAPMGTGLLDHEALIKASDALEPHKMFCIEHIRNMEGFKKAFNYIQGIADNIGHKWTDPKLTRDRWLKMKGRR